MRHRGKIESTINNARRARELAREHGSLAAFFWRHEPAAADRPRRLTLAALRRMALTPASTRLSKELKACGFSFVGPTTVYAFMQAMGLVNDHLEGCAIRERAERARPLPAAPRRGGHIARWTLGFSLDRARLGCPLTATARRRRVAAGRDEARAGLRAQRYADGPRLRPACCAALSGGQQQRVGVARALAASPRVMLLDEPFGALDPLTRDRLQHSFVALRRRLGLTAVFVTHDMAEALRAGRPHRRHARRPPGAARDARRAGAPARRRGRGAAARHAAPAGPRRRRSRFEAAP